MNNVEFIPAFAQKSVKRTANRPLCRRNMGPGESNQGKAYKAPQGKRDC